MHGHCDHRGESRGDKWGAGRHRRRRFGGFGFGGRHGGGLWRHGPRRYVRARRMLAQGDLRLIALALIAEAPRHGYEIIKLVEEKTGDWYSPSPGIVYPTLTYLEEAGYVTASTEGSKKLYTITDEGRAYLDGQSRPRRRRARSPDRAWRTGQPLAPRRARRARQSPHAAAAGRGRPSIICARRSASVSKTMPRPKRVLSKSSPAP